MLKKWWLVVTYLYMLCSTALAADYDFGTAGVNALPIEREQELGTYFMTVARAQLPLIYDPVSQQYLNAMVGRLAARASGVHFPFEIIFVRDPTINAAAFFGGKIMVHSGLIEATETESEFASVLAHEMTHVTQRHLARSIEEQSRAQMSGMVGVVGSIILAIINPVAGMAGVSASLGGVAQNQLNYTRSNEYEADRLGIELLYAAGFNPDGMANMMRKLRIKGEIINPAFEMLMTHPLSEKRVAEAENRARGYKKRNYYESIDYAFFRSRVLVRFSGHSAKFNKNEAEQILVQHPNNYGAMYQLALASLALQNYTVAENMLNQLAKRFPRNLFIVDTFADLYMAQKNFTKAKSYLTNLSQVMPNNEVIQINLAVAYKELKEYKQAERLLKRISRNNISVVADEMLLEVYRAKLDTCSLYTLHTNILEYKGQWDQAINSANQAVRHCSEQNTVLKLRAQMSRIVEERDFYKNLLGS